MPRRFTYLRGLQRNGAPSALLCVVAACGRSPASALGSSHAVDAGVVAMPTAQIAAQAFVADACVRDEHGAVWCWNGGPSGTASAPIRMKLFEGAASVVSAPVFTYIVKTDGSVWTYGIAQDPGGSAARHDQKIYKDASVPERFEALTNIVAMSASVFGLALRADGALLSWEESYERNANDEYVGYKRTTPALVKTLPTAKALNGRYAIERSGRLFFIEYGADNKTLEPIWIPEVTGATQVILCSGNAIDACALTDSGAVDCWKRATGTSEISFAPAVTGLPSATRIACSNDDLYAIDHSGDVYAWNFATPGHRGSVAHAQNLHAVKDIQPRLGTVVEPHCIIGQSGVVGCWASQHKLGRGDWVSWVSGFEGKPFTAVTEPISKGVDLMKMHSEVPTP